MQFRTEIQIPPAPHQLDRFQGIFTLGSCFAEVIGNRLLQVKANALVNPFGTVFNPLSIHALLRLALLKDTSGLEVGLVEQNGRWYHYDFHSSFSHAQPEALLKELQQQIECAHIYLTQAQAILLTWGTAYVYERQDTGALVANCHKIPQRNFTKRLLSLQEMEEDMRQTMTLLHQSHPHIQVMLTVSPVRHLKDTLPLNAVSKSLLRVAAHLAQEQYPQLTYFPAYELLLDDLRDYRFYAEDLLHPSAVAETYIWEKFIQAYASPAFRLFIDRWQQVQRDLTHRPFQPESPGHQKFLHQLLNRLQEMAPEADVQEEIATVQRQLRMP